MKIFSKKNTGDEVYFEYFGNCLPKMINIGGKHPLWDNMDISSFIGNDDIKLDHEDNSAELIYVCNTLEHITDLQAYSLLSECMRVLKRNGHLRITTRNINQFNYARMNKDVFLFDHIPNFRKHSINQLFLNEFASQCSALNGDNFISDKEIESSLYSNAFFEVLNDICGNKIDLTKHKISDNINWFNIFKIRSIFENTLGITKNLFISQYGQSNIPVMRNVAYFDNFLPQKSLYFEVRK